MRSNARLLSIAAVMIIFILALWALPAIPQDPAYHLMADRRLIFGVSNFWNVVSNLPFLIAGAYGAGFVLKQLHSAGSAAFADSNEAWPYLAFFAGVMLTSAGSAYYHLTPMNETLVWDRLPMTIAFTSFVAALVAERMSVKTGLVLLVPLLLIGASSVFYWRWTELQGRGDLRFYGAVQFFPILIVAMLLAFFPAQYSRSMNLVWVFVLYAIAKVFEQLDGAIFRLGGIVSGHTLKHLAAALAAYVLLLMLKKRMRYHRLEPRGVSAST